MRIVPKFPKHRFHDPKRQAELAVYRELEASTTPGVVLYEPRFGPYSRGLDFAGWLRDIGRYGLEVKGGHHSVEGATWWLSTPAGQQEIDCPALQAWDGAMAMRDRIARKKGKGPFVIAALVFPDMAPDVSVREALADSPVHAIFGVEDLTGQLSRLAHVDHPPSADDILREVALVTGAEPEPEPETDASMLPEPETDASMLPVSDLRVEHLVIHHVEHLHIHRHFPDEPGAEVA